MTYRTGEGSGVYNKTIKARRTEIKTTFTEHSGGRQFAKHYQLLERCC
jgi:hypothetical protein